MNPEIISYKPGDFLFRENDRSRDMFIIRSGKVKIFRNAAGHTIEIGTVGSGAVLGEMALIDGKPRSASAAAAEPCTATVIDPATFETKIRGIPPWFYSIIRIVSTKLRHANEHIERLKLNSTGINILLGTQYLFLRSAADPGGKPVIDQAGACAELPATLCVSPESVSSIFEYAKQRNFVSLFRGMVTCLDMGRFSEYCSFLRLFVRKSFEHLREISPDSGHVLQEMQLSLKVSCAEKKQVTLGGDEFHVVCAAAGCEAQKRNIIDEIRKLEILSRVQVPDNKDSGQKPVLYINCELFFKYYLYSAYKDMVPGK